MYTSAVACERAYGTREKVGCTHKLPSPTRTRKRQVKDKERTRYLAGRRPGGKEHIVQAQLPLDVVHRGREDLYTSAGVITHVISPINAGHECYGLRMLMSGMPWRMVTSLCLQGPCCTARVPCCIIHIQHTF